MVIMAFILLTTSVAPLTLTSCSKDEEEETGIETDSDDYSPWRDVTDADSIIFADARTAFLSNPANVGSTEFMTLQVLPIKPLAVRTKAIKGVGTNYQFDFITCEITVLKGDNDEVGTVIEVITEDSGPGYHPIKRDTITDDN